MTTIWNRIRGMMAAIGVLAAAVPPVVALPADVTVTKPASLELMRNGKVSGTIALQPGQKLDVIDLQGDYVLVSYHSLSGRVPVALTNLPRPEPPAPEPEWKPTKPVVLPPPAVRVAVATPIERVLSGKLVALEGGALRPYAAARLTGVKFYAFYFSASWCPPCREFTPGFVETYAKLREQFPELEVVLVNADHSAGEMLAYMVGDRMKWPALRWEDIRSTPLINHYCGEGIPCLVLVDATGKVLSDSFHGSDYVGPRAVVADTWKILQEYRRKNPKVKT